jgi:hypothetical protein
MTGDWLYDLNLGLILLGTLLIFLLSLVIGYWAGRRARKEGVEDSQINTIQAATLGLSDCCWHLLSWQPPVREPPRSGAAGSMPLARLAAGTNDARPHNTQSAIMREYVDTRLEFYDAGIDPIRLQQAIDKNQQIQDQLWQQAIAVSAIDPRSVPTGLFIQSLNEVIDLHAARLAAMKNRVPEVIIVLIFIVSIVTLSLIGYALGMFQHRSFIPTLMALILIAIIIVAIIDLDAPRSGLIRISQESMIKLQQSLK